MSRVGKLGTYCDILYVHVLYWLLAPTKFVNMHTGGLQLNHTGVGVMQTITSGQQTVYIGMRLLCSKFCSIPHFPKCVPIIL